MKITCDLAKRAKTLEDRGLDFMDAMRKANEREIRQYRERLEEG